MNEKDIIALGLDTASRNGSLAILKGNKVIAERKDFDNSRFSERLLPDIKEMIDEAEINASQIDLIAVGAGPGSFTGVRIGLATVKGLQSALKLKTVGVSILEAISLNAASENLISAAIPAGRGEVFAQLFSQGDDKEITCEKEVRNLPLLPLLQELSVHNSLEWITTAEIQAEISHFRMQSSADLQWKISDIPANLAISVANIGVKRMLQNQIEENLTPLYVRGADIGKKS